MRTPIFANFCTVLKPQHLALERQENQLENTLEGRRFVSSVSTPCLQVRDGVWGARYVWHGTLHSHLVQVLCSDLSEHVAALMVRKNKLIGGKDNVAHALWWVESISLAFMSMPPHALYGIKQLVMIYLGFGNESCEALPFGKEDDRRFQHRSRTGPSSGCGASLPGTSADRTRLSWLGWWFPELFGMACAFTCAGNRVSVRRKVFFASRVALLEHSLKLSHSFWAFFSYHALHVWFYPQKRWPTMYLNSSI